MKLARQSESKCLGLDLLFVVSDRNENNTALLRGSFATVKEGVRKDTGQKVAIKVIDKKDAVFDAESLEQEVSADSVKKKTVQCDN
jgi:hypothetical protein